MTIELMRQRKAAIDWASTAVAPVICGLHEARTRISVTHPRVTSELVSHLLELLERRKGSGGPGIALISGSPGPLAATRQFSLDIMAALRAGMPVSGEFAAHNTHVAETVTVDGSIPLEQFGTAWTFKPPHMDREAIYFSHVYGPARGFGGGEVILIDALAYVSSAGLSFDQVFDWSDEPVSQKPVMKPAHVLDATRDFGISLGALPDNEILIVNNTPDGGILHGATELLDIQPGFTREIHRVAIRPGSGKP